MRYGKDLIKRIISELEKVPNIRHVCNKVGIDHSTFYRWIGNHFEFHKEVENALYLGRRNICDAAESVIISGIQAGDMRSSIYWLSHNNERYIEEKRVRYFQHLAEQGKYFLTKETPDDSMFEKLFEYCFDLERTMGEDFSRKYCEPFIDILCRENQNLKEVFNSAYAEWRGNKLRLEEMRKKADPDGDFA